MSLWSGKTLILVLGILTLVGFATGGIWINRDRTKCYLAKHWTFDDGWRTWLAVGRLEFRYKPVNFDCIPEAKYDPKVYKVQNGLLVPISNDPNQP